METLGFLLAFPVTAGASAVYAGLAVTVFSRFRALRLTLLVGSIFVTLLAFTEAAIIWLAGGAVPARSWLGPKFDTLHGVVFFLTPPAVANLIVFIPRPPLRDWKLVAGVTWLICLSFIFWNYEMSEKLYGPDGIGGPFSSQRP